MIIRLIIIHTKGGDGVELSDLIESIDILDYIAVHGVHREKR